MVRNGLMNVKTIAIFAKVDQWIIVTYNKNDLVPGKLQMNYWFCFPKSLIKFSWFTFWNAHYVLQIKRHIFYFITHNKIGDTLMRMLFFLLTYDFSSKPIKLCSLKVTLSKIFNPLIHNVPKWSDALLKSCSIFD